MWWKDAPNAIDKGESVVLGPKVNVERVKLVVVFILVSGIVCGQMPFIMTLDVAHGQAHHAVMAV